MRNWRPHGSQYSQLASQLHLPNSRQILPCVGDVAAPRSCVRNRRWIGHPEVQVGLESIGAFRVGLIVFAIGLSLGDTTGYASTWLEILEHTSHTRFFPSPTIANKRDSDWAYAAIPVLGALAEGVLAAVLYLALG